MRIITNNPNATPLPTPSRQTSITNENDVSRKIPSAALASEVVTEQDLDDTAGDQFRRADAQIQFLPDTPSGSSPVSIKVAVTNDVDVINQFTEVEGCRVTITGGTLSGSATIRQGGAVSPAGGPLDITFFDGEATLLIEDAGTGTVELSLVDTKGSGLDVTDVATVTIT